jgi:DNA polymerase-3 subunit delta
MRLPPARIAGFLQQPDPGVRAVLVYGPDAGLVRERAETLARTVCQDLADAFRVAELSGTVLAADPARLADEAAQLSLVGGRRVVRVRGADDAQGRIFAGFLAEMPGDALVIVEAGDLPRASALRRAFEGAQHAAAIACYADGARDRATVVRDSLAAHRVSASRDAVQYLVDHLGGDRLVTRSELEKLALYAGDGGRVALDDAVLLVGDSAALELDDAVMAAAEGDAVRLDRVLDRVFQEGAAAVTVVRAMLRHLHRLQLLADAVAGGAPIDAVMRNARPPIFFKHQESVARQLGRWRAALLRAALDHVSRAEINIKTTGFPPESLCREALLKVALVARGDA